MKKPASGIVAMVLFPMGIASDGIYLFVLLTGPRRVSDLSGHGKRDSFWHRFLQQTRRHQEQPGPPLRPRRRLLSGGQEVSAPQLLTTGDRRSRKIFPNWVPVLFGMIVPQPQTGSLFASSSQPWTRRVTHSADLLRVADLHPCDP